MSTTIAGKLNDVAKEFPNSAGVNFLIRLGKKERDFKTKTDVWANYSAFVFAKEGPQADFYRRVLVAGSVVQVTCQGLIPEVYGDNNNVTLKMQNPSVTFVNSADNAPARQQSSPQQAPMQQAPQQAPAQQQPAPGGFDNFDDSDMPF